MPTYDTQHDLHLNLTENYDICSATGGQFLKDFTWPLPL